MPSPMHFMTPYLFMEYLPIVTTLLLLFFTLLLTTNATNPQCSSSSKPNTSNDLSLFHIYGDCSPFSRSQRGPNPWPNTVLNMGSKDSKRIEFLDSLVAQKPTKAPIGSGQNILNIGSYLVRAQIGSPAQLMFMVLDTSYDTSWVPCSECSGCTSSVLFSPNSSATFGPFDCSSAQCTLARGLVCTESGPISPCQFNQSYGGDSSFLATLSRDELKLGNDVIPDYNFGCITLVSGKSIPPQGLLGLGRGPLSLISQTNSLYNGTFSYCLPSFKSYYFSGSLKLGPTGQPAQIKTTPLLKNPHRASLYYVNLTAVSVGRVSVPIPAQFDPDTGSGTIIDSGTVITRFVPAVYESIRAEFRAQVNGPFSQIGAFDTCFPVTNEQVAPTVTLHFDGLDLKLPMENSMIHSSARSMACLAMSSNVNSLLNIIGSLQQQNLRIMFDTVNSRLGIARELCN